MDIQELRTKIGANRLGRVWRWGRSPRTIPIVLLAPASLTGVDAICRLFPDIDRATAESCRLEFLRNGRFFEELNRNFVAKRFRRTNCEGWNEFLYLAVRFARPTRVLETGVFDGLSSAVILQALADNGGGELISIDLPARDPIEDSTTRMRDTMLPAAASPGWVVPSYLQERFRLVLGDSREWLPRLLHEYQTIDIFFHDSLHTYDHQYFEYSAAWPHLNERGLLLSDDIFWNPAFHKFCKEKERAYVNVDGFGAVKK